MVAETEGQANADAAQAKDAPRRTLSRAEALRESLKYSAASSGVPGGDTSPRDMDVFRYALSRRIYTLLGDARRCREAICRRTKRCAGPDMRCARDFPAPPVTEEQRSKMLADIMHALKRRAAELEL